MLRAARSLRPSIITCLVLLGLSSAQAVAAPSGSAPAAEALRILDAYRTADPQPSTRKLHVVVWRSREREFPADYRARLRGMMEHIRTFYADEMERNGFGRLTFPLDYNSAGELVIHEAVGSGTYADYDKKTGGTPTRDDCWRVLKAAGIDPDRETIVLFTNLAQWDPVALTFKHHSPYMGSGNNRSGLAWQLDHPGLAIGNLPLKTPLLQDGEYGRISLGKHNSIFIGGIAHELGHALGLPHCRESVEEARTLGTALMGSGNRTFRDELRGEGKGSFLTLDSAMRLASHPLFSGSVKGVDLPAEATFSGLSVTAQRSEIVLSGTVTGVAPVYAVLAYLDPSEPAQDYDARTVVAVPDAAGAFALACRELVAGRSAEVRLVACMANGATSTDRHAYTVAKDGTPDVSAMHASFVMQPFLSALATNPQQAIRMSLNFPRDSRERQLATKILAGRMGKLVQHMPAEVPTDLKGMALSHIKPVAAKVGWGRPAYDHLPRTQALLIAGGELFEYGIYAHAPASYRYDLTGGGWKRLTGKCGLPSDQGSVVFVIRADGKEVLRTKKIESSRTQAFDVDLAGVRELELVTEDAGDGNRSDWGLWLGAELRR